MSVSLYLALQAQHNTYVQFSLRVSVKQSTITQSVRKFGTSDTIATNLASSADDHALSRYRPPWYIVTAAIPSVNTLLSTKVDVMNVQG